MTQTPHISLAVDNTVDEEGIPKPDGTLPPSSNWLQPLPLNTRFLASTKGTIPAQYGYVAEFFVVAKLDRSVLLWHVDNEPDKDAWVNSAQFCNMHTLHEIFPKDE